MNVFCLQTSTFLYSYEVILVERRTFCNISVKWEYFSYKGDVGRAKRNRRAVRNQDPEEGHHHPGFHITISNHWHQCHHVEQSKSSKRTRPSSTSHGFQAPQIFFKHLSDRHHRNDHNHEAMITRMTTSSARWWRSGCWPWRSSLHSSSNSTPVFRLWWE